MYNYKKILAVSCLPMIALIAGLLLIYCAEDAPERCGDGHALNTYTQFCHNNQTYDKCEQYTKEYDPNTHGCILDVVLPKCGNGYYDPAIEFCHNNVRVVEKCNNSQFNADVFFCHKNTLISLCGSKPYDPERQMCDSTGTIVDTLALEVWFNVYFEGNGATVGVPGAIRSYPDSAITLPAAMTRTGYTFSAWGTKADGTGTNYAAGTSYIVATNDVTLYAIWASEMFTITFMGNGAASGVPLPINAAFASIITLPAQGTMVNGDLHFKGWNTHPSGTGQNFAAGTATFQVTGNVVLYARWVPVDYVAYILTFDGNADGVTGIPAPMDAGMATGITIPTQINIVREGYTFAGWNTQRNGAGTDYVGGNSYQVTGEDTLFAKWTIINYEITYKLDSGTVSSANPTIYHIETATFTLNNPTRTGYTFDGWTGANGTVPQIEITIPLGSSGIKSYTANWTPIKYTVTFDANGATGDVPVAVEDDYDKVITLPTTMTRTGYTFGGWNTNADGTGTNRGAGTSYTIAGDITFYAKWTLINYTISYTLNGGTVSPANPITYNVETATFTLNNPTIPGYTFDGWTGANGAVPEMTVTIEKGNIGGRTYTANWTWIKGSQFNPDITYGSLTDERDGQAYRTVVIGDQTWMAENLNYRNTTGESDTVGRCYDNQPDSCAKYGRLYRWVEVMNIAPTYQTTLWGGSDVTHQGICPVGWHVPSSAEWDVLTAYVGGVYSDLNWNYAGTKLKSKTGWYDGDEYYIVGADDFGFSALPGGGGHSGNFYDAGNRGYWWSATEIDARSARFRNMYYYYDYVRSTSGVKDFSFSVRCLRDD